MELKNVEIIKIKPLQQVTDTYKKVEFIVKLDDKYPQEVQFEVSQDRADNFIKFNKEGQFVDIDYNLRGRSYLKVGDKEENRRWFNTLDAWKVFKAEVQDTSKQSPAPVEKFTPAVNINEEDDLDLPF